MAREVPSSEFPSLTAKLDPKTWYMIYPILKFETTGLNSGTHVKLYEYKEDDKLFYLALKYHKFEKLIVVGNTNFEDEEFDGRAMAALCSLIYEKLAAEELFETVLSGAADRELSSFLKSRNSHPFVPLNAPTYPFIVDDEHEKVLFEKDIDLPAGFEVRSLDPNHADQMIELLLHAQDGDADQAAIRIAELPSVGIFEKATDKLVAFEYNDGIGYIAHQYVYPEYRGRGFGKAVEILVSRKNITELGIRPAKCVAISRPKVQAITSKAGYWTKLTNAKGEPAHVWWTIYSKTPKTPIQIFDN